MSDALVSERHLHAMNIMSGFALFTFNMRGRRACDSLALLVCALSPRVCREAAPSTTLGTGSNYGLNHFITNFTFFPVSQELQTCRLNIIKARLQIKLALFWGLDGEYWGTSGVWLCVCVMSHISPVSICLYLFRIRV